MTATSTSIPDFLNKSVEFPNGASYILLHALTDYRACDQGSPLESRIVCTCREKSEKSSQEEFIIKIKVQLPSGTGGSQTTEKQHAEQEQGPSTTTASELRALRMFRRADSHVAPRLLDFKVGTQSDDGPLPGGYITYTLMNKIHGDSLYNLHYWGMPVEEREEITTKFVDVLREIYELGIQPDDRALRNIIWDKQTKKCAIIDFEMWTPTKETVTDETKELQRWGLAKTPPRMWWEIWFDSGH